MTERRGTNDQQNEQHSEPSIASGAQPSGGAVHTEEASIPDVPDYTKSEVARKREDIRAWLAGTLTGLFVTLIVATFLVALFGTEQAWSQIQELFRDIFTALVALVGSVVGFYFGSQRP